MIWTIILISTFDIPWVSRCREFQSNPTNSCANDLFNISRDSFSVTNKNKWYKSPEINWSVPWSIVLIPNKIQHQNRFMKTHKVGLLGFLITTMFCLYKQITSSSINHSLFTIISTVGFLSPSMLQFFSIFHQQSHQRKISLQSGYTINMNYSNERIFIISKFFYCS